MSPSQPRNVHVYVEHEYATSSMGGSAYRDSGTGEGGRWGSAGGVPAMNVTDTVLASGGHMRFANEHMKVYTVPRSLQLEVSEPCT